MDWKPIETAPKDRTEVLITCAGKGMIVCIGRWVSPDARLEHEPPDEAWWLICRHDHGKSYSSGMRPTHWMPIPTPPDTDD